MSHGAHLKEYAINSVSMSHSVLPVYTKIPVFSLYSSPMEKKNNGEGCRENTGISERGTE